MKKMIALLFAVFGTVSLFGAVYTPEQIANQKELLAKASNSWQKADYESNLAVCGEDDPGTFADILAKTKTIYAKYNLSELLARNKACQIACWVYKGKFVREAYAVALADQNVFLYYISRHHQAILGLDRQTVFDNCMTILYSGKISAAVNVKQVVELLLQYAPDCDEAKTKVSLKKLNRKYSLKLISDKASWEPVVAMIRTAIDAY